MSDVKRHTQRQRQNYQPYKDCHQIGEVKHQVALLYDDNTEEGFFSLYVGPGILTIMHWKSSSFAIHSASCSKLAHLQGTAPLSMPLRLGHLPGLLGPS